jgi:hypothetical protein
MCTMVTGKNLYESALILCCYGYQTGDISELQTVILWSMMVLASFCDIKMFIQNNFIFKFSYN